MHRETQNLELLLFSLPLFLTLNVISPIFFTFISNVERYFLMIYILFLLFSVLSTRASDYNFVNAARVPCGNNYRNFEGNWISTVFGNNDGEKFHFVAFFFFCFIYPMNPVQGY